MPSGKDRGSMIHGRGVPGSKELQAEMKLQTGRTPAFAALQICQPADPGVCCLWIALMMCEHSELAGAEIWGTLSHSWPIHICHLPGELSDEDRPSMWVVRVSVCGYFPQEDVCCLQGWVGLLFRPVPSVALHGQKREETLSQVPAGKAVELTNYMGNLGFSSEMVDENV